MSISKNFRDPRAHRVAMRRDLRPLADQRDIDMGDDAAQLVHQLAARSRNTCEEAPRQRSSVGGKCAPISARRDRAQNRIGQGMQTGIGIRMTGEAAIVRYLHAAQPDMIAVREAMRVEARAGANIAERGRSESLGEREILCGRQFQIHLFARNGRDRKSGAFGKRRSSVAGSTTQRPGARSRIFSKRKPCGVCARTKFSRGTIS